MDFGEAASAIGTICSQLVNILVIVILAKVKRIPYLLEFRKHFGWDISLVKTYLRKSSMIIANEVLIGAGKSYDIMQIHMYSGKWIRPVSDAGQRTIEDFRRKYGIKVFVRHH